MVRSLFPRLSILKAFAPRVAPPLLPVARLRPFAVSRPRLFYRPSSRPSPREGPPSPDPGLPSLASDATLSQRLKHLIKSYGWYALGVYMLLSVVDFGVAFAGISLLGADYVAQVAASIKQSIASVLHSHPLEPGRDEIDSTGTRPGQPGQEGLYAMLVLAYTIHKTLFFPLRIGLTAAFTPKLVGWLSRRGWAGGAGARRAAAEMRGKLRGRNN